MYHLRTLLLVSCLTVAHASTVQLPGSDANHSIDLSVTNLSFHETGPAPGGNYFDYATTLTGANGAAGVTVPNAISVQILSNMNPLDQPWVHFANIGWVAINAYLGGSQGLFYAPFVTGESVTFELHQADGQVFNTAIHLTGGGALSASAVRASADAPEPGTFVLIGLGLALAGVVKRSGKGCAK